MRIHGLSAAALLAFSLTVAGPSLAAKKDTPLTVEGATTVDTGKAKTLHDKGAVFVDVRSQMMWDAGRIPNAVFMPIGVVTEDALSKACKKDKDLVVYCQGKKCIRSSQAAVKAVSWGFSKVYYYRDGFPGWKSAGHEVE